ncbi:hypothetical protein ACJX0J_036869, partial [Zea mays]
RIQIILVNELECNLGKLGICLGNNTGKVETFTLSLKPIWMSEKSKYLARISLPSKREFYIEFHLCNKSDNSHVIGMGTQISTGSRDQLAKLLREEEIRIYNEYFHMIANGKNIKKNLLVIYASKGSSELA